MYVLVRILTSILCFLNIRMADDLEYKMLFDEHYLRNEIDTSNTPIMHHAEITELQPYEYIYGKYERGTALLSYCVGVTSSFNSITVYRAGVSSLVPHSRSH